VSRRKRGVKILVGLRLSDRIVIITEIIAPYRIPVFNALAKQDGVDLHVVFLAETDITQRQWLVYKEEIRFSYEVLPSWRRRISGNNILLNRGVAASLKRFAPDAIILGGYNYLATWQAWWWAIRRQVPVLLWSESHGGEPRSRNPLIEFFKRSFLKKCRGFLVPGSAAAKYLIGYGVPAESIFVAPNAVANDIFAVGADAARQSGENYRQQLGLPARFFLFVGRLVLEKGIFDLMEAYARLRPETRASFALVLIGDGPCRTELENKISNISPGRILVTGFVQRNQLAIYYGLADCLVFPTHSDAWGLVVNEAMAAGLPIVAADVAGCVDDLVSADNGQIIKAKDIDALAAAMQSMADSLCLTEMGSSSRRKIAGFTPELWAKGVKHATDSTKRYGA
jgi:glycosyltransferase involved in cell wall biosynthesis